MTAAGAPTCPAARCAELELARLEPRFGPGLGVTALRDEEPLPDATSKAVVRDARGRPVAFATCSSAVRPDLVALSLHNAAAARSLLGPRLGAPVIVPLAEGVLEGLSYALFAYHAPYPTRGLRFRLLRGRLERSALGWLVDVAAACRRGPVESDARHAFRKALEAAHAQERLPPRMRNAAEGALTRLASGDWSPAHVIDHNDFWIGNLLGARTPGGGDPPGLPFVVIDWAGANVRGFGVHDSVRIAQSLRVRAESLAPHLAKYASAIGCDLRDLAGHFLASTGHLATNLGFFSVDRFVAGSEECFDILTAAVRACA